MLPLISICVPAYGEPELLKKCLQSIAEQDYPNIEVIVSDDTPDERVKIICNEVKDSLALHYFHNQPSLGSPANWNAALEKGKGTLLLLLHHDDWLSQKTSISKFAKPLLDNPTIDAVFGTTETTNANGISSIQKIDLEELHQHPVNLLLANKVGPPSNLMIRNSINVRYNLVYRWLVDIDYYIQALLKGSKFYYVPEKLISVGVHANQTTNVFQQNPMLVLKENIVFARTYHSQFSGWKIYDHYWRLIRNTSVDLEDWKAMGISYDEIPNFIRQILNAQRKWSKKMLLIGPFSKTLMLLSYLKNGF